MNKQEKVSGNAKVSGAEVSGDAIWTAGVVSVETPRNGQTLIHFSNGFQLSVGHGKGHYASWVIGERFPSFREERMGYHFPTSVEVVLFCPSGRTIPLVDSADSISSCEPLGYMPVEFIHDIVRHLESLSLIYTNELYTVEELRQEYTVIMREFMSNYRTRE